MLYRNRRGFDADPSAPWGEREFRRLLDKLPIAAYACNPDGLITAFNQRAAELWGREPKLLEPTDRYCGSFKLFAPDGTPVAHNQCWMAQALRTRRDFENRQIVIERPDGSRLTALAHAIPFRDEHGGLLGAVNVLVEANESNQPAPGLNESLERLVAQRTAEVERRAAQLRVLASSLTVAEQRERLRIAGVLHDQLAQSLAVAKIKLSAAALTVSDDHAQVAIQQVDRAIADAIRDTRELMHDPSPPMLHDVGLAAALGGLADRMKRQHGLQVHVGAAPLVESPPLGEELRTLLFQAARELLHNAAKHGGASKAVITLGKSDEHGVSLSVADDGCGFAPDATPLRPDGGGLGLFRLRERVELLGGQLEIDSHHVRAGTVVCLRVPVVVHADGADRGSMRPSIAPIAANRKAGMGLTGKIRIMLADDHRILRQGLAGVLVDQGDLELVGEAQDGEEALELADRLVPDVAVIDVSMPRLNGIEVTRRLTASHPEIAVVGLSMHMETDMADRMRQAGAAAYLTKDGPIENLLMTIRDMARRSDADPATP